MISIALVLPSLIGSLFEAAQSTISAIDEFRVPSSLPIELWFVPEVSVVSSAYKSILDEVT